MEESGRVDERGIPKDQIAVLWAWQTVNDLLRVAGSA